MSRRLFLLLLLLPPLLLLFTSTRIKHQLLAWCVG
jgi:hypothetical protein